MLVHNIYEQSSNRSHGWDSLYSGTPHFGCGGGGGGISYLGCLPLMTDNVGMFAVTIMTGCQLSATAKYVQSQQCAVTA